jgi:geranylgeranyl pyrophosphate synthase
VSVPLLSIEECVALWSRGQDGWHPDCADDAEAASLEAAGVDLGYSYQFLDDVADVEAGVAEVGKERGMDAAKCTAVNLFGVGCARAKALEFQTRSLAHLERFGAEADWLRCRVCEASWKAS